MTDVWTVVSNGQLVGRFPEHQLVHWVASGQVSPYDLFWRDGMNIAAPAHTVAPFSAYYAPGGVVTSPALGDSAAARWLLPVGRAPWALAAGYLGLFSILGVFGPFAIVAGILGVRQIQANPRRHGMGRAIFGIVAGALGTIGLLAFVLGRG